MQQQRQHISASEDQGRHKFISLMSSLLQHIQQDNSHQLTIYQCLNSSEINQLFQSIHDYDRSLRIIAIRFITRLLYNCQSIVQSLMLLQNNQISVAGKGEHKKILITGLKHYNPKKIGEYILAIKKIVYKRNCLYWYINCKTLKIGYKMIGQDSINPIDSQDNLIGIFLTNQIIYNSHSSKDFRKQGQKLSQNLGNKTPHSPQITKNQSKNIIKTAKSFQTGRFSIGSAATKRYGNSVHTQK